MKKDLSPAKPRRALSSDLDQAAAALRTILRNPVCQGHMNMSTVKGFLGELLVMGALMDAGEAVEQLGNQAGYDLSVPAHKLRLDVKCSTIKTELHPHFRHWGWPLKTEAKKRSISCTHFVCVGLDEDLALASLHVVPKQEVSQFPKPPGRFKTVESALAVPVEARQDRSLLDKAALQFLEECDRLRSSRSAISVRPANGRILLRCLSRE